MKKSGASEGDPLVIAVQNPKTRFTMRGLRRLGERRSSERYELPMFIALPGEIYTKTYGWLGPGGCDFGCSQPIEPGTPVCLRLFLLGLAMDVEVQGRVERLNVSPEGIRISVKFCNVSSEIRILLDQWFQLLRLAYAEDVDCEPEEVGIVSASAA